MPFLVAKNWFIREQTPSQVPHSHIPHGRDGSGFYSDHHTICYHVNNAAIPLVVDTVQSTVIKPGSVFTIVDYGTADGGTSMPLMYACVKAIREKYGQELPINIIYEDQPVNDFKSLFMRLQGLIPGPPSYLVDFTNVFVLASGTNYYDQCFPSNSVDLVFLLRVCIG
ncbi:hypothetical protein QZH41_003715 [Actinostola sp. cb2023]|nr:hypothetical protein QZH41_003715 [Actinostola sp. cb2023]